MGPRDAPAFQLVHRDETLQLLRSILHDDDVRLRFSDSALPGGTLTEMSAACCTGLLDGPTLDVRPWCHRR